jgi:hypothetical protein
MADLLGGFPLACEALFYRVIAPNAIRRKSSRE